MSGLFSPVFGIALLAVVTANAAALTYPAVVQPDANGITQVEITVDMATHTIGSLGTFTTRSYYYDGTTTFSGPTLFLEPGGNLNLTLHNNLGPNPASDSTKAMNEFRHVNTTNLHTHGLHVDPNIDSVFRHAQPGESLNYFTPIPADHAPGTHWYHAHTHGPSTLQVMGGLFGVVVIKPTAALSLPTNMTGLSEVVFMIHFLKVVSDINQDCEGAGSVAFNPFKLHSVAELEASLDAYGNGTHTSTITSDVMLINGQHQPNITMSPGQSLYFRTVFTAVGSHPALEIRPSTCTMVVVAHDGVYVQQPYTSTKLHYSPGSRIDVIITCPAAGTYEVVNSDADMSGVVAYLLVTGTNTTGIDATTLPLSSITPPAYLPNVSTATPDNLHQVHFTQGGSPVCIYWFGQGTDCSAGVADSTCTYSAFTGSGGTNPSNYAFAMPLGNVGEITLYGLGAEPHPLHIHINHFMITSYVPNEGGQSLADVGLQLYQWRDNIPALNGVFKLRFTAATHTGETIFHCHVLAHEDQGLMSSFYIYNSSTTTLATTTTPDPLVLPPPTATDPLAPPPGPTNPFSTTAASEESSPFGNASATSGSHHANGRTAAFYFIFTISLLLQFVW